MGRAFNRLERTVSGRAQGRSRSIGFSQRVRELEVFLLELGAYVSTIATDAQSPGDLAFVEAYTAFKKHLEGTVV